MRTLSHIRIFTTAALAALVFAAGCGKKAKTRPVPPVPVTAGQAVIKDMPVQISTFGKVEAYSVTPVKTMVSGPISAFHIKPGDYVKKDAVLFEIDKRPFEAEVLRSRAALDRSKVLLDDYVRQAEMKERLLETKAVDVNSTKTARAQAESQRANVAADEAALKTAQLNLEYCTVRSHIDGRAGDILIHEGTVVKSNEMSVIELAQLKPVYVAFAVAQADLPAIQRYFRSGKMRVRVQVPVEGGAEGDGELTFVDNAVSPVSGTVKLKAVFPNADMMLWPGQFVNVVLTLTVEPKQVTVPSSAVSTGQSGSYVFVLKDDSTVDFKPVKTGRTVDNETIITEGLSGGEKLVTSGQIRLYPGAKIYEAGPDGEPVRPPSDGKDSGAGRAKKNSGAKPPERKN